MNREVLRGENKGRTAVLVCPGRTNASLPIGEAYPLTIFNGWALGLKGSTHYWSRCPRPPTSNGAPSNDVERPALLFPQPGYAYELWRLFHTASYVPLFFLFLPS